MDPRTKELIDFTRQELGLESYTLVSHQFQRTVNLLNETVYTFSMEWQPEHQPEHEEEGINPVGTACVELNVHTRQFQSVIFVGNKSNASWVTFDCGDKNEIIRWVENRTGFKLGERLKLTKEEGGEYVFREIIDEIELSPAGFIDLTVNPEGKLTSFSIHGPFAAEVGQRVRRETFALTLDQAEHIAQQQLQLIEFPSDQQNRLLPIYALEEIYITNDCRTTLPYPFFEGVKVEIGEQLHWNTPLHSPLEKEQIELADEVTAEQAFSGESSPASRRITEEEQKNCVQAVLDALRREYPDDSGKWVLHTLHRDQLYIHATLKRNENDNRLLQKKLIVFIDAQSGKPVNIMDNSPLLEMFDHLQEPGLIEVTKEEAFAKLKALLELKPIYVYDDKQKEYILCGKLDCHYGIHAETGELIALNDI